MAAGQLPRSAAVRVVAASLVALLLIGALAVVVSGIAGSRIENNAERQVVQGAELTGFGTGFPDLRPSLLERGFGKGQVRQMDKAVAEARVSNAGFAAVAFLDRHGRVVYSTTRGIRRDTHRSPQVRAALNGQTVSAERHDEDGLLFDAYLPLQTGAGVYGVLVMSFTHASIERQISDERTEFYLVIGGGGLLIWLLLSPLLVRLAKLASREYRPGRQRDLRALRHAIQQGRLEVHYQPKVDVASSRLVGAEALVRWPRNGSLVPPAEFLPLAEQSKLIDPLTDFVLDRAIAEASRWRREGREISVAVNLSPRSVSDPSIAARVEAALKRHRVPPGLLCLEITETALMDTEAAASVLGALSELGVELSLDDFGTGYSSLTRASLLPLSEIKIDRSFIGDLGPDQHSVVAAMIGLGEALGLRVVAEGVESRAALVALGELGCDVAQGYYFAPPLPPHEFDQWRAVARSSSVGLGYMLCEADFDGYLLNLRGPWSDALGFSHEELVSRPYAEFVHPDDLARTLAAAAGLADGPSEVVKFENRYRTKGGAWRRLLWSAQSDGERIYAMARDMTAEETKTVEADGAGEEPASEDSVPQWSAPHV